MWISRQAYEDLRQVGLTASARAEAEIVANRAVKESLNWLMLRVTQLERERAVFVEKLFGVKIAVPEIAPAQVHDPFAEDKYGETMSFEPMSEHEAKRAKISHNEAGELVYG